MIEIAKETQIVAWMIVAALCVFIRATSPIPLKWRDAPQIVVEWFLAGLTIWGLFAAAEMIINDVITLS